MAHHVFTELKIAIIEIGGFQKFDKFIQPAVLPHLPFHGLAENLAVSYYDDTFTRFLRKIKRSVWSEDICRYMTDYQEESAVCLNTEDVCPQCDFCLVSTQ